jgi:hypothetical protein
MTTGRINQVTTDRYRPTGNILHIEPLRDQRTIQQYDAGWVYFSLPLNRDRIGALVCDRSETKRRESMDAWQLES